MDGINTVKLCPICQRYFHPLVGHQKYCSPRCREKRTTYKAKKKIKKICVQCKKPFYSQREKQRFCSRNCREEYYYIKQYRWTICINCGERFENSKRQQRYCSKKCYREVKNKRENERYLLNKSKKNIRSNQ